VKEVGFELRVKVKELWMMRVVNFWKELNWYV